jgi:transglutaminase-like putative cysteine protease
MLLEIRHLTQYHYAEPVRASVMELWAQPRKDPRQRLISFELEVEPAAQLFSYVDAFGNAVYHFDVPQPHDRLSIESRATVDTEAPAPLPDQLDLGEWERMNSHFVQGECFDFLHPHGFAIQTEALAAFVAEHDLDRLRRVDPLTAVKTLMETIYAAFAYAQGVTGADSPIDEALKAGRGVCQDFAHIMIAICRSWGMPARYVSGYLLTLSSEQGDRSNPDATHAWVEVYLPSLHWVGFDPTNNVLAGERHVTVAVGRDYGDVPPSRGVYKGDAESELMVAVSVRRARAAAADPEFMRMARPAFSNGAGRRRQASPLLEQAVQQQQ